MRNNFRPCEIVVAIPEAEEPTLCSKQNSEQQNQELKQRNKAVLDKVKQKNEKLK